jgi:hypothetical protein
MRFWSRSLSEGLRPYPFWIQWDRWRPAISSASCRTPCPARPSRTWRAPRQLSRPDFMTANEGDDRGDRSACSATSSFANRLADSVSPGATQRVSIWMLRGSAQLGAAAESFAAERRVEIEAAAKRMDADAAQAEEGVVSLVATHWSQVPLVVTRAHRAWAG